MRIGLAGGGTDVSPYCDLYGGAVLNATISLYAHAKLEITGGQIIIESTDRQERAIFEISNNLPINGQLDLHKAVYNRLQKDFILPRIGFSLSTATDAPAGSGLGTSSTLVVAILGAFLNLYEMQLSEHEVAQYAYEIERTDLQFSGGRQDQYAASYGGFNFMEFGENNQAGISPILLDETYINLLQNNLLLYFTNSSRNSADIIDEQVKNVLSKNEESLNAMHFLKEQAILMRDVMLSSPTDQMGPLLDVSFAQKKKMAHNISNNAIEEVYAAAMRAGATGGKISGAGGGGFMVFYCPDNTRKNVAETLLTFGGEIKEYIFVQEGLHTWQNP